MKRAVELESFHSLILNTLNFEKRASIGRRAFVRSFVQSASNVSPVSLSFSLTLERVSEIYERYAASSVVIIVIANNYSTQQADASSFRIKLGLNIPSITRGRFTVPATGA